MGNNNKISTKFDIEKSENEEYFKMKYDKLKTEASISINIKLFTLNPKTFLFLWPTFS